MVSKWCLGFRPSTAAKSRPDKSIFTAAPGASWATPAPVRRMLRRSQIRTVLVLTSGSPCPARPKAPDCRTCGSLWVDEIHFAPPKEPWNDGYPANSNEQWFPMVSKWCRVLSIHCMITSNSEAGVLTMADAKTYQTDSAIPKALLITHRSRAR